MVYAIINAFLFLLTLLVHTIKRKRYDSFSYLLTIWAFVAIDSVFLCHLMPGYWHLVLWPYLYLWGVFLVFIWPFKSFTLSENSLSIFDNKLLLLLAWVYVLVAIMSIVYTLPYASVNYASADWDTIRDEIYMDEESVQLYHSQLEKLVKNLRGYIEMFALIYGFYLLTQPRLKKLLVVLLFLSWLGYYYVTSILLASRGMLTGQIILLGLLYVIFRNHIPQRRRRIFKYFAISFGVFIFVFLFAVTFSRFGTGNEGKQSLVYYFGTSMVSFNDGIAQHIQHFAGGKRFFKWFIDFLGGDSSYGSLGHTAGSSFVTFIGNFYMDFGPVGTVLFALLMIPVLGFFTKKKQYRFSDLTVIVFFAFYYLKGVFVYGAGTSLQWFMTFILYFIIRFIESPKRL